jgi:hypothetical protein
MTVAAEGTHAWAGPPQRARLSEFLSGLVTSYDLLLCQDWILNIC